MPLFRRDRSDWPQGRATVLDERGTHPVQLDLDVQIPPAASYRVTVACEAPLGFAGNLRGRTLPVPAREPTSGGSSPSTA